jgi:FAD/FMN-containing dehydrogenase
LLNLANERAGGSVTGFELIPRIALEFAVRHAPSCRDPLNDRHPWYVLMELSSQAREGLRAVTEEILEAGAAQGLVADATIAASLDQAKAFWLLRHHIADTQKYEGGSIKHDVSVPVAAVADFIIEASAAVEAMIPGCRPCPFGHLGDGNVHFNISQPLKPAKTGVNALMGADRAEFLSHWDAVNATVFAIVARHGGSISAEHGIGVMKRDLLPGVKDPVALSLMHDFKRLLDPNRILNPGKVL